MDRNLALEAVRVTEAAALAAFGHLGQGDEVAADGSAAQAMSTALAEMAIAGRIDIGDGAAGNGLDAGKKIGTGEGPDVGIAVMPLEGNSIIARGGYNAVSAIAFSAKGSFLGVPNIYMDKIATGPNLPDGVIDLDAPPVDNLHAVAKAKGIAPDELVVCILDRPRHGDMIAALREAGARIRLILDGDMSGAVATAFRGGGVDLFIGSGLAPQGVLAAAALRAAGGQMQARLIFRNDSDREQAAAAGLTDPDARYTIADMVPSDVTFAATGITDGPLLRGIERAQDGVISHSVVMRSHSGTVRRIEALHRGGCKDASA